MSITVTEYTPKTHEMHSWQMELDVIESHLVDATKNVTTLQTVIDQLDEQATSARALLEDQAVSRNQKNKANSILSKSEAERQKSSRQLDAAKSRLKAVQAKKDNFNFPALQEEQRLKKLVRNLVS
jgi:chromosome segregation ATPase